MRLPQKRILWICSNLYPSRLIFVTGSISFRNFVSEMQIISLSQMKVLLNFEWYSILFSCMHAVTKRLAYTQISKRNL